MLSYDNCNFPNHKIMSEETISSMITAVGEIIVLKQKKAYSEK